MFTFFRQLKNNFSKSKRLINQSKLIAVDFETTGLDPNKDEIISMGFCPIRNDAIPLAECVHFTVKTEIFLTSENVAIHGLTDDKLEQGLTKEQAFYKFLELTKGKIIIAHFHTIEKSFIQKLAVQIVGSSFPLIFIDTLDFAKKQMIKKQQVISPDSLRLFNLRKQYGLPNYKAHNALEDAISTAELFLVQKASLNLSIDKIRLKDMGVFNYKK